MKWRERGYGIFQAIEKHARTRYGYTTVRGIDDNQVQLLDDMPRYVPSSPPFFFIRALLVVWVG